MYEIYEDLRKHFDEDEGVPIPITLDKVSNLLLCSKRNVNFVLKRLVEKNWVTWQPGRGRGNSSVIVFHLSIQDMYMEVAKDKVKNDDISGSLRIIENHITDVFLKDKFFQWLHHSFGVNSGLTHDQSDTLRLPILKEIGSLDPILTTCGIEAHLARNIFDTLVTYHPEQGRIEPGLAHFWKNKNHMEWTLYIRKGVFFHDGSECTAKDVVYTFHRLMKLQSLYNWMVRDISHIHAVNNWTIQIQLDKPNRYFLHYLAAHPLSIMQNNSLQESNLPIGTGPFKATENNEHKLVLQANSYHYSGRPFLDRIELWKTIRHSSINGVRPDVFQLDKLTLNKPNQKQQQWNTATKVENGCKMLTFNLTNKGPQQNKYFRKAIHSLLIRKELVKLIHWEDYKPAYRLLPGKDFSDEGQQSNYKACAKEYVSKSGYEGQPVILYCSVYHEKDAFLLQKVCEEIGICIEVRFIKKNKDVPYPKIDDAQIILFECLFDHDLTFSLLDMYMTEGSYIRRNLSPILLSDVENKIASHIHDLHSSVNIKGVLDDIEQTLVNEEYAFICLYRRHKTIQYSDSLAGIQIEPLGWVNFKKIWSLE